MYFKFSELQDWVKRSGEGRRRIMRCCLVFFHSDFITQKQAWQYRGRAEKGYSAENVVKCLQMFVDFGILSLKNQYRQFAGSPSGGMG